MTVNSSSWLSSLCNAVSAAQSRHIAPSNYCHCWEARSKVNDYSTAWHVQYLFPWVRTTSPGVPSSSFSSCCEAEPSTGPPVPVSVGTMSRSAVALAAAAALSDASSIAYGVFMTVGRRGGEGEG